MQNLLLQLLDYMMLTAMPLVNALECIYCFATQLDVFADLVSKSTLVFAFENSSTFYHAINLWYSMSFIVCSFGCSLSKSWRVVPLDAPRPVYWPGRIISATIWFAIAFTTYLLLIHFGPALYTISYAYLYHGVDLANYAVFSTVLCLFAFRFNYRFLLKLLAAVRGVVGANPPQGYRKNLLTDKGFVRRAVRVSNKKINGYVAAYSIIFSCCFFMFWCVIFADFSPALMVSPFQAVVGLILLFKFTFTKLAELLGARAERDSRYNLYYLWFEEHMGYSNLRTLWYSWKHFAIKFKDPVRAAHVTYAYINATALIYGLAMLFSHPEAVYGAFGAMLASGSFILFDLSGSFAANGWSLEDALIADYCLIAFWFFHTMGLILFLALIGNGGVRFNHEIWWTPAPQTRLWYKIEFLRFAVVGPPHFYALWFLYDLLAAGSGRNPHGRFFGDYFPKKRAEMLAEIEREESRKGFSKPYTLVGPEHTPTVSPCSTGNCPVPPTVSPCSTGNCPVPPTVSPCSTGNCPVPPTVSPCSTGNCPVPPATTVECTTGLCDVDTLVLNQVRQERVYDFGHPLLNEIANSKTEYWPMGERVMPNMTRHGRIIPAPLHPSIPEAHPALPPYVPNAVNAEAPSYVNDRDLARAEKWISRDRAEAAFRFKNEKDLSSYGYSFPQRVSMSGDIPGCVHYGSSGHEYIVVDPVPFERVARVFKATQDPMRLSARPAFLDQLLYPVLSSYEATFLLTTFSFPLYFMFMLFFNIYHQKDALQLCYLLKTPIRFNYNIGRLEGAIWRLPFAAYFSLIVFSSFILCVFISGIFTFGTQPHEFWVDLSLAGHIRLTDNFFRPWAGPLRQVQQIVQASGFILHHYGYTQSSFYDHCTPNFH